MAAAAQGLADDDGDFSDWIEVHNSGTNTLSLLDWSLTDSSSKLTKWRFPETNLVAGSFLVVFASEKNRGIPGAPLHTNFKLASDGEYLALIEPDGQTVASEFAPRFPPQRVNVSYGVGNVRVDTPLVETGALARVLVPLDATLGPSWTDPGFDDSSWGTGPTGLGYDVSGAGFGRWIGTDLQSALYQHHTTAYIRIPFVVTDPRVFDHLSLLIQYDDGFIAYLNGLQIASANDPVDRSWNSAAASDRNDADALAFEQYGLDAQRGLLRSGTNWLAIHALNAAADDSAFLVNPRLVAARDLPDAGDPRYFTIPTPGSVNRAGVANLGPVISAVVHDPAQPFESESMTVTARVTPTFGPVGAVMLHYRAMYQAESLLPMLDDGAHGDGAAGDGVYGADIPGSAGQAGQMLRWFVTAQDSQGRSSRWPLFDDPLNTPQYLGTMRRSSVTSGIPVLHWFVEKPLAAETEVGARSSLYYDGEFYDNIAVHIRGQASRGYPKKSFKFDFQPGHHFLYDRRQARIEEMNVNTTYADKSFLRVTLAWESFRNAGAPHCQAFPLRLQQNGAFYSVATFVEEPDEIMLRRNGLDPNGAFYKMFTPLNSASGNQKTTRLWENDSDLRALVSALKQATPVRTAWLYDNINIPAVLDYMAVICLLHDNDCPHKNYWMYRDTDGTGEWRMFPWDKDLCLGRNYVGGLDDEIWANIDVIADRANVSPSHPFFMDRTHQKYDFQLNYLIDALYSVPAIKDMYRRHLRTVMDRQLQAPETPHDQLRYERRIQELYGVMQPDVQLDRVKWIYGYGQPLSFEQGLGQIVTNYLPLRRIHLYNKHNATNSSYSLCALLPSQQAEDLTLLFGPIEPSPVSGRQAEEYVQLFNTNLFSVDLSGWKISGSIEYLFQPGVVLPAQSTLYLSPNVKAFRARTQEPHGGQNLFVQGNYRGELSARGGTLRLTDPTGRLVNQLDYAAAPSPAQQYLRVTEIMYHPAPLPGSAYDQEQFEFMELKNIGPSELDLAGLRFTRGVAFNFSEGTLQHLSAGATVLLVRNQAAFTSRYPGLLPVAGQYVGSLDNSSEVLRLEDASGEVILEFAYHDSWAPISDGAGFSLVAAEPSAPWSEWRLPTRWRASSAEGGSPGVEDPPVSAVPPVRINEVRARTVPPLKDAVELFNPTVSEVVLGGWWLTDDFSTPRKYRIPAGTRIAGLGYLVLDEAQFNPQPGVPPSFSFSADGDEVYLYSGDLAGSLTGYVHGFRFGAAATGATFGAHVNSVGESSVVALVSPTLGAANSPALVGPVVISEIMYHPLEFGGVIEPVPLEFVELHNLSYAAVPLYDPAAPTNTWSLSGGVDFTFPHGITLDPDGYAVVVAFDPVRAHALAAFRARYGLPESVRVFGPFEGRLNNAGESLRLLRPEAPLANGPPPLVLVEEVHYQNAWPWPPLADGYGASLQRKDERAFGDDPAQWVAAAPGAGRSYAGGEAPSIGDLTPASQRAGAYQSVAISASAAGTPPLQYQWLLEGAPLLGATNLPLALERIQPLQQGRFQVVVLGPAGAALSSHATVGLDYPPLLTSQPRSQVAVTNNAATFSVTAIGSGPLRYQWQINGHTLEGATKATLTVSNITFEHQGAYSVIVSDGIGSTLSPPGILTVTTRPTLLSQPQSQTVVQGDSVTFSVLVSGTEPLGYRWRRNGINLAGAQKSTLTLTNVQLVNSGAKYSVVVTNLSPTPKTSDEAVLTVLADFDGDHMADVWEVANGLSTNNAADALLDSDGDGLNNYQEFVAGTDPQDGRSYLRIDFQPLLASGPGEWVLQFVAVSNKTYTVQATETLGVGAWSNVALRGPQSETGLVTVTNSVSSPVRLRYYRLVTPGLP